MKIKEEVIRNTKQLAEGAIGLARSQFRGALETAARQSITTAIVLLSSLLATLWITVTTTIWIAQFWGSQMASLAMAGFVSLVAATLAWANHLPKKIKAPSDDLGGLESKVQASGRLTMNGSSEYYRQLIVQAGDNLAEVPGEIKEVAAAAMDPTSLALVVFNRNPMTCVFTAAALGLYIGRRPPPLNLSN